MNKKSWCCCLGPGGRTEKDWLPLTLSYLYRFSLWMSPLPKMEVMQFCMGQSKEFFILTVTVSGWYCSALSGICRKTEHVEKGQGCRATGMPSSAVHALKPLSSLPPWASLLRRLLCPSSNLSASALSSATPHTVSVAPFFVSESWRHLHRLWKSV